MKLTKQSFIGFLLIALVALYLLIRSVPAGVYMPRRYSSLLTGYASAPSCLGFTLTHYVKYDDYSVGLWVVLNNGPFVQYDVETEIAVNVKIAPDLSLTPVGVKAARQPNHISSIMSWDNAIAYVTDGASEEAWLALFEGQEVRMRKGIIEDRIPGVLQLDDEDIMPGCGGMRFGRHLTDSEWEFFDKERPMRVPCHILRTCADPNMDANGGGDVTLYTARAEGGLSTNVYPCPLSDMGCVTAMGTPTNAYFASFNRITSPRTTASRVPDQLTYTIWNRSGVVRVIDVPPGISPEAEVCPYASDGRQYIVYLYTKQTKRHHVDVGVTFVDLATGEAQDREVRVKIPE
jgi:hypothetical protein